MITVTILGREFPLNLGVEAMKEIKNRFGDVDKAVEAVESENSFEKLDQNIVMLAALIKSGVDAYNFEHLGEKPLAAPSEEILSSIITIADLSELEPKIVAAIEEGTGRNILSTPDKEKN